MNKRLAIVLTITVVALVIVFGGSFGFHFFKDAMIAKAMAAFQPPPSTVAATEAKQVMWRPYTEAVGTLQAVNGVQVANAIEGKVVKIAFQSGDDVKQGDLLVQLDDTQEQALLDQYQAKAELARGKYQRALAMRKKNLNSEQDLDTARSDYKAAQAQVAAEQAIIDKKSVNAPFAGQVGIREVNLGQYLSTGTAVVNLVQLTPLFITFTVPQTDLSILHNGQDVALALDAYPDQAFAGKITAINPAINEQSRMIQVQATIPNEKELLRPGMFVNIKVLADQAEQKVVVPMTAISYSLYGDTVYLLEPVGQTAGAGDKGAAKDKSAAPAAGGGQQVYLTKQVFVKPGSQRGKLVAVTGIEAGQMVVTAGQLKLHKGSRVIINNSVDLGKERELTP